jgi:hypothetical protein
LKYSDAFTALGYELQSVRQDWSAEKADGVCITIWKRGMDWRTMSSDTRTRARDIEIWGKKSGNRKRTTHAKRALEQFDGWIDAILISGAPGVSYEDAQIWVPAEKGGQRWRVTFLDEETGHIRLEAQ